MVCLGRKIIYLDSPYTYGKVQIESVGSLDLGCKYTLANVKFECLSGSDDENQSALVVWGQSGSIINNCDFNGVKIKGNLSNYGNILRMRNSKIYNIPAAAIKTIGAGVNLLNVQFTDCVEGLHIEAMTLPSLVQNCKINIVQYPPDYGIWCSALNSELNVTNTEIIADVNGYWGTGIFTEGPLTLNLRCNKINYFTAGVHVSAGGTLNISANLNAGYNDISKNKDISSYKMINSIYLQDANAITMDNGYNDISAPCPSFNVSCPLQDIYGNIIQTTSDISANNNRWYVGNTPGWPGNQDSKTSVSNSNGSYVPFYDGAPANLAACGSHDNPPTPNPTNLLRVCASCTNITTPHFNNIPYNEAVRIAISNMELEDSTQNDLTAITMFKEILLYSIPAGNTSMKWLSDLSFAKMNAALSNAFATGRITTADNTTTLHASVQDVLTVYSHFTTTPTQTNYLNQFYLDFSKAQIYRLAGRYDLAKNYLDNISNCYIGNEEIRQLNNAKLIVNAESLISTQQITQQQFSSMLKTLVPPAIIKNNISETANINTTAKIGTNVKIGTNATIEQNVTIGNNVTIGSNVTIKKDCIIKDGASISDNTVIEKSNTIGKDNIIGVNVKLKKECITGDNVALADNVNLEETSKIGGFVTIGVNTKFQKNANIADGTSIGVNGNFDKDIKIGSNVTILDNAVFRKEVQVGDRTTIGNNVTINQTTKIGSDVTVANNINIGSNARVSNNQTVTANVPNNGSVGAGTPTVPATPGQVAYNCTFAQTNAKLRINMLNGFTVIIPPSQGGTQGGYFATNTPLQFKPNTLSLNYQWNFGDCSVVPPFQGGTQGGIETHTYTKPGVYVITLTQTVKCTTVTYTGAITIYPAPNAAYSNHPQPVCSASNKFKFDKSNNVGDLHTILYNCQTGLCSNDPAGLDTSLYRVKFNWNFGTVRPAFAETFTLKQLAQNADSNITCTFPQSGLYPVTLTAILEIKNKLTNTWTTTDVSRVYTDTIHAGDHIIADFEFTQPACYKDTVYFTNKTQYGKTPYTYNWTFAFHSTSTLANPAHKYLAAGIYNVSLIATDALGCKDTAIKQIIIPECPGIYGYLSEHADCGGAPVIGDTLYFIDELGYTYDTIYAVTNNTGQFAFNISKVNQLDTTYNYSFKIKSGYGITQMQYNSISYWKNSSPLSFVTDHKEYWTRDFNMSDSAICSSTAIDLNRNLYVAGSAYYPASKTDYLLIKYDPLGNEQWHVSYNPSGFGWYNLYDMKTDKTGNCILTGYGDDGTLTVKIDASGTVIWSNIWTDNTYFGESAYLAIDSLNNIYLASNVSDNNTGQYYFALTKYNNSGQKLWSTVYNADSMTVRSLKIDNTGNILVLCNQYSVGGYIFKYAPSGALLWTVQNTENLIDLATGPDNSIYTAGTDNNTRFVTVKYNTSGVVQWQQYYSYADVSGSNVAYKIAVDNSGNIISVGTSPALPTLYHNVWIGHNRYSYVKYSPAGDELWNTSFITGSALGSVQSLSSMVTDKADNIYTAGREFYSQILGGRPAKSHAQFLATKINSDGSFAWFETDSTSKENPGQLSDLIVSDNENLYVTGATTLGVRTIKYVQCPSNANNARYSHTGNDSNNSTTNNEQQTTTNDSERSERMTNDKLEYVTMYPNPNDGNFYFIYSLPENEKCRFAVFDQIGKKVYDIEIKSGKNTVMINHNDFSNGVYYYQVTAGNRLIKTERLVITK